MNLIQCDLPCKHQKEGYCQLDKPKAVTNTVQNGCMYYAGSKNPPSAPN